MARILPRHRNCWRMRLTRKAAVAALLAGLTSFAAPAFSQELFEGLTLPKVLDDWDISGSNTLRLDQYTVTGDEGASPFQFEGFQPYNDFDFSFARRIGAYEEVKGDLSGVINRSPYRGTEENLVFERANLTWEKGDAAVPYRLEAGDFFGFFSVRTLQTALKGGQIDLQPSFSLGGERHAFQLLGGFIDSNYRDVDIGRDAYTGASWLMETDHYGRFALNIVRNTREEDVAIGKGGLNQSVVSLAGERGFDVMGQKINIEGEVARFDGDIDLGTSARTDRSALGIFLALEGRSKDPLTYSARYQNYEDDFRPNGSAVTPNRRSLELRSGYDFGKGRRLDGRYEMFTDNLQEGRAQDTAVVGITATSPLPADWLPNSTLRFDGFIQDVETNDQSTNQRTTSTTVDLTTPFGDDWTGRVGLNWVVSDDDVTGVKAVTRQFNLNADRAVSLYEFAGTITPGLFLRTQSGPSESDDFGPSLAVNLSSGPHSINANYSAAFLNREGGTSVDNHDLTATYGYTMGVHSFGAEVEFHKRAPAEAEEGTNSYKFGAFWRVSFNKPAKIATPTDGARQPPSPSDTRSFRLNSIAPGQTLARARTIIADAGLGAGVSQPGVIVSESRLLPNIDQRQRLAVAHANGRVTKTALIINFDNVANTAGVTRTFNRVQEELIRRYGAPSSTFNIGTFSASLFNDVNSSSLIRNAEWRTEGGSIRFGIPRRLDRKVRMEVQFAPSFAPPRTTLWSVESVR